MPRARTSDSIELYYEETGSGFPVVFVHEFLGTLRSWEPQIRHFSHLYRCVAFNARGYPPSDVPNDVALYSQERAAADIADLLRHLKIDQAHIVGFSMGSYAALHFALAYPGMTRSLVIAGGGYGSDRTWRDKAVADFNATAERFEAQGSAAVAEQMAVGPQRVQFQNKDPRGWAEFKQALAQHSARGMAMTLRGIQTKRPSVWDLADGMKRLSAPTLIIAGDEDEPSLEGSLFMKRTIPRAGLVVLAKTGHTLNLEEPEAFNRAVQDFLAAVEAGGWAPRDPRSKVASISGYDQGRSS